jgi:hypothetical protein
MDEMDLPNGREAEQRRSAALDRLIARGKRDRVWYQTPRRRFWWGMSSLVYTAGRETLKWLLGIAVLIAIFMGAWKYFAGDFGGAIPYVLILVVLLLFSFVYQITIDIRDAFTELLEEVDDIRVNGPPKWSRKGDCED